MTEQQERVAEFARELRDGPEPSDRSIKEIWAAIQPQVQELVNRQVELAKTEMAPIGRQAGIAIGLLLAGALFMLVFLIVLSFAGVYALHLFLPIWASALIVSGVLLVIGGIFAGIGAGRLRGLDPKPYHTIRTFQQNVNWLKGQLKR